MRPRANSIANLSYNLLGYFPAPSVYGFAVFLAGKPNSGWGMGALMYATTFMPIFILCACLCDPNLNLNNLFQTPSQKIEKNVISNDQPTKKSKEEDNATKKAQEL